MRRPRVDDQLNIIERFHIFNVKLDSIRSRQIVLDRDLTVYYCKYLSIGHWNSEVPIVMHRFNNYIISNGNALYQEFVEYILSMKPVMDRISRTTIYNGRHILLRNGLPIYYIPVTGQHFPSEMNGLLSSFNEVIDSRSIYISDLNRQYLSLIPGEMILYIKYNLSRRLWCNSSDRDGIPIYLYGTDVPIVEANSSYTITQMLDPFIRRIFETIPALYQDITILYS
jgi:hypothetical protein